MKADLSIRTTLDPQMQIWARQALTRGLMQFDRTKGWRGAVDKVDVTGDWSAALAKFAMPKDLAPWRLAAVLKLTRTPKPSSASSLIPRVMRRRRRRRYRSH